MYIFGAAVFKAIPKLLICVTLRAIDRSSQLRGEVDGMGERLRNYVEGGFLAWLCGHSAI